MVPVSFLRSAARGATSSLSRFQCTITTPMKAKGSGIAVANRYLTSSSSSGSSRSSTGNGTIGSIIPTDRPNQSPVSSTSTSTSSATHKDPSSSGSTLSSSSSSPNTASTSTSTTTTAASEYVYVHPLSQIVLQHLQSEECHEWMKQAGLDRNLTVHRDGTFSLESRAAASVPTTPTTSDTTTTSGDAAGSTASTTDTNTNTNHAGANVRIWTAYCPDEKKHWLTYSSSTVDSNDHGSSSSSGSSTFSTDSTADADTDTDTDDSTTATRVRHRFLLQDNEQTAWNNDKTSLPDRVREFVSELMLVTVPKTGTPTKTA